MKCFMVIKQLKTNIINTLLFEFICNLSNSSDKFLLLAENKNIIISKWNKCK
jgi:hypothetical protein